MPGTPHRSDADLTVALLVDLVIRTCAPGVREQALAAIRAATARAGSADQLVNDQDAMAILIAGLSAIWLPAGRLFSDGLMAAGRRAFDLFDMDWDEYGEQFVSRSEAAAQQRSAWLATSFVEETRAAIRAVLLASFSASATTRDLARAILAIPGFGLSEEQALSLLRFGQNLIAGGTGGVNAAITAALRSRIGSMLSHRALRVAWTEAAYAANVAVDVAGRTAVELGVIRGDQWAWKWVTRSMQPCPRCVSLDGSLRPLPGGLFTGAPLKTGSLAGTSLSAAIPPLHPWCQCALELARV